MLTRDEAWRIPANLAKLPEVRAHWPLAAPPAAAVATPMPPNQGTRKMLVRLAKPDECDALTELAMRAKASWGYPDDFMCACQPELTMAQAKIAAWTVWVGVGGSMGKARERQITSRPTSATSSTKWAERKIHRTVKRLGREPGLFLEDDSEVAV